jgi:hypothetical protein
MKKQLLLMAVVFSFASPVMADQVDRAVQNAATPTVGENPPNRVDHRGTQCKYAKALADARAGVIEANAGVPANRAAAAIR